jgi:hypothetical protein
LFSIIGAKETELIMLRGKLAQLEAQIKDQDKAKKEDE